MDALEKYIWIMCYEKKSSFDKPKYTDIMESEGYDLNSIISDENFDNSEFQKDYNYIHQICNKFSEEMITSINTIAINITKIKNI